MKVYGCEKYKVLIEEGVRILKTWFRGEIEVKDCPLKGREDLGSAFASLRVLSPDGPLNSNPHVLERRFEERRLRECLCGRGVVYEGKGYSFLCRCLLDVPFEEGTVFITLDYIATREKEDPRFHLRYAVFGYPVILSLPGILEAPAKAKSFYIAKALGLKSLEKTLTSLDPRFPRVLAGILLQSIFFFMTGNPFCDDPYCSLYNAHTEAELLVAQKDYPYVLCPSHEKVLKGKG